MEQSVRFISFSGWSGILVGIYALAAAVWAYNQSPFHASGNTYMHEKQHSLPTDYMLAGLLLLLVSLSTAAILSYRKARKKNLPYWNGAAKRFLWHVSIPLLTGGVLIVQLLLSENYTLIAAYMLIFYGLALINGSQFAWKELKNLGLLEILLGLICVFNTDYSLLFWACGFGCLHIVYGVIMHYTYDR